MNSLVSIIILNWNGNFDTIECIKSVLDQNYKNFSLILVDNNSTDNSVKEIKTKFPEVMIIQNEKNEGYAKGNNIGLEYASRTAAEFIFLLNNDTILTKDCLRSLVDDISGYPNIGAIAPISFYYNDKQRTYFSGGKISPLGQTQHLQYSTNDIKKISKPYHTDWITGCAILIRKRVYLEVGGFDPEYFLLFEDVDWSIRIKSAGYDLMMSPKAWLYHKVSASFGQDLSPAYLYYYTRNNLLFLKNHFPIKQRIKAYYFQLKRLHALISRNQLTQPGQYKVLMRSFKKGIIDFVLRRFGKQPNI